MRKIILSSYSSTGFECSLSHNLLDPWGISFDFPFLILRLKRWGDEASRICNENRQTQKIPDKNANSHVKKTLRIIHTESLVRVEIERGKNEVSALISCQSCKHKSFLLSPISCFCARSKIIFITCVRA